MYTHHGHNIIIPNIVAHSFIQFKIAFKQHEATKIELTTLDDLTIGVGAGFAGVGVVHTAGGVVEHLDDHLAVPLVQEGELAAGLEVEVTGELVPPRVQVHLALPVEQDLHGPAAEVAASLP